MFLLDRYVEYDVIHSYEDYWAIPEDKRWSYDFLCTNMEWPGGWCLEDMFSNNKNLKWFHNLGGNLNIMGFLDKQVKNKSKVQVTDSRGIFTQPMNDYLKLAII